MSRRKRLLYTILAFFAGCIITLIIITLLLHKVTAKEGNEIVLEYGDTFLDVPLLDSNGKAVDLQGYNKDYSFVFYLDKNCGTCIDDLTIIKRIIDVYEEMNVENMIIWDGEIGIKQTQKKAISEDHNYILEDAYISTPTPTFYILDERKEIIFTCNSIRDMVKKIALLDISNMELINEKYIRTLSNKQDTDKKPIMVYFSMIGCPDCEAASHIIKESNLQEMFHIMTFYRDKDNVPIENQQWIDNGDVLAEIYGIEWYPSFLILYDSGEFKIVGKTDSNDLENVLLNCM